MRDYLLLFFDDKNILSRSGVVRKLGSPKIVGHYQDPQAVTANGLPSVWHDQDIIRNEYFVGDMLPCKRKHCSRKLCLCLKRNNLSRWTLTFLWNGL
jgi:hypothetical protein